jgi:hypothetical protein
MALFWHHDNNKVKMYVVFFKNLINKQHIIINNKYYIAFIVEQKDTTCIACVGSMLCFINIPTELRIILSSEFNK